MEIKSNVKSAVLNSPITNTNGPIALMVTLFFIFGIITVFNDVLIPHLKAQFDLTYLKAILIQFTFFSAYFLMALPAAKVIMSKGYKNSIVIGLLVVVLGCLLFYPAAQLVLYPLFLLALFVMASGITLLQVSANPYLAAMGSPDTASTRLNLAGGFNSFATVIGPLLGAHFILSEGAIRNGGDHVQQPYIALASFIFLLAITLHFYRLPTLAIESNEGSKQGAWKYRQLRLGVLAIFLYVGAEVSIGSFMINYLSLDQIAGFTESTAARYVALYWGGAMVGRFMGVLFLKKVKVPLALSLISACAFLLVLVSILSLGNLAMWSIVAVGLFNSLMWPCIFTLSIKDLGKHTSQASGLLIMAVVGGAIVPLVQGYLADHWSLQSSFVVSLVCYAYLLFYGLHGHKPKHSEL